MTVKTGQVWEGLFVTQDATGALATPSVGPIGTLYVNGVANGAVVTITGSNPYKFSVTLPALTAGQRVDMYITATISTIATASVIASEQADTMLLSDGITLADDAITAAKFDESTAFPLKLADTGSNAVARVGADSDTLETLSDQMDVAALEATLTAIKGAGWSTETLHAIYDLVATVSASAIADAVLNELLADHTTAGSLSKAISDILTDTDVTLPALIAAVQAWASAAIAASYTAGAITQIRGNSWNVPMTGMTLNTTKQQLAIKRNAHDLDADAILFVDSVTGLLTLNGVSTGLTPTDAVLTYAGTTLTLTIDDASITAQLPVGVLKYGVQGIDAAGKVAETYGGTWTINADIVMATA